MNKRLKIFTGFLILAGFLAVGYGASKYGSAVLILALFIWAGAVILEDFRKFESVNKNAKISLRAFIIAAMTTKIIICAVLSPLLFFLLKGFYGALDLYVPFNEKTGIAATAAVITVIAVSFHFSRRWIVRKELLLTFRLLGVKVNENQIIAAIK